MTQIKTVGDLVAALQKLPQNDPVLVGCHYDNDDGLKDGVEVHREYVDQCDTYGPTKFFMGTDPPDPGFWAVTVS